MINQGLEGQTLDGRYQIERLIGRGATGVVYSAFDGRLNRPVALKLLKPDESKRSGVWLGRFFRGARLARRLKHPSIVTTYDYGRWGERREGAYLTMELVNGVSLGKLDSQLSLGKLISLVVQVLDALGHVHARGVLHRDIKPNNILLVR